MRDAEKGKIWEATTVAGISKGETLEQNRRRIPTNMRFFSYCSSLLPLQGFQKGIPRDINIGEEKKGLRQDSAPTDSKKGRVGMRRGSGLLFLKATGFRLICCLKIVSEI